MPDGFEQAPDRTSRRSKVQMFALSTTPMPERYERHGQASATWPSWLVHALPDRHYGTRRSLGWRNRFICRATADYVSLSQL